MLELVYDMPVIGLIYVAAVAMLFKFAIRSHRKMKAKERQVRIETSRFRWLRVVNGTIYFAGPRRWITAQDPRVRSEHQCRPALDMMGSGSPPPHIPRTQRCYVEPFTLEASDDLD